MKKILVVYGTRPELIKLAPVIRALDQSEEFFSYTVFSGQHPNLIAGLDEWFQIRPNKVLNNFDVGGSIESFVGNSLLAMKKILSDQNPDLLICQGDTTTAFVAALSAFYHRVPIAHVEAGLRSYDLMNPWPEEGNRLLIDRISEYAFVPSESSKQNLIREGFDPRRIWITGNTGLDALRYSINRVKRPEMCDEFRLENNRFGIITIHRRESQGEDQACLRNALIELASEFPHYKWVFPRHPNPQVLKVFEECEYPVNLIRTEAIAYEEFCWFIANCDCIITDSGGLQEEGPFLGKPVFVVRNETERPEVIESGNAELIGLDGNHLKNRMRRYLENPEDYAGMRTPSRCFGNGYASSKILDVLSSNLKS